MRTWTGTVLCTLALGVTTLVETAHAAEQDVLRELELLRAEMEEMRTRHAREMAELRARLDGESSGTELDRAVDQLLADSDHEGHGHRRTRPREGFALDWNVVVTAAAGASDARGETLRGLNAGGHDPGRRGVTLQAAELSIGAQLDPWTTARATVVVAQDPESQETFTEIEEAWLATRALHPHLRLRGGQYATVFGRHNVRHGHEWDFVNAPIVQTRFLGPDGLRGLGAEARWTPDHDGPLVFHLGLQNANGETMTSFLGTDEDEEEGHAHGAVVTPGERVGREVRSPSDLVVSGRAAVRFGAESHGHAHDHPWELGLSWAHGPSGASADGDTRLLGADLSWTHELGDDGSALRLAVEALRRDLDFDGFRDEDGVLRPASTHRDHGWHASAVWDVDRHWSLGLRHGEVSGDGPVHHGELGLEDRRRTSLAITRTFPSWGHVRLQFDRDDSEALDRAVDSVWLQVEFHFGGEPTHSDASGAHHGPTHEH